MSEPTLALCIPAYNAAEYLPRLLSSAEGQTVPFDEILVYDDCSSDETSAVAEAYGANVIRGRVNVGCSTGKNRLARATTCDWVHFHDADDELTPRFVETARAWMVQEDAPDVVLFAYEYRDNETMELLATKTFDDRALRSDPVAYAIRVQINPFCGIYKRAAFLEVGGYDVDPLVLFNEDVALHVHLALSGLRFAADPTVTVLNYRVGGSMSQGNRTKCFRAHYHVLRKAATRIGPEHQAVLGEALWKAAGICASVLDWESADAAAALARQLGKRWPDRGRRWFQMVARVSPRLALRSREVAIRALRPSLRANR